MKVLITGSNGFIGKNLRLFLAERKDIDLEFLSSRDDATALHSRLQGVDFVFHLAGVNRPRDPSEFSTGNVDSTRTLLNAIASVAEASGRPPASVVFTSSTQASHDNAYGKSKREAETVLADFGRTSKVPVHVFRLPNVFGKWCKPNYNSAVATFCHNVARDLPIQINDPASPLTLVYIDDVIRRFVELMDGADPAPDANGFEVVTPQYTTTVGEVARHIRTFRQGRETLITERVGGGFMRALYSTYVSYLPPEDFAYPVAKHEDPRGMFVEMLKTPDCGQFSFFTAHPGVTRGGHYHHTKTEKFLVIKGQALFKFRHMHSGETCELATDGATPRIVETVPGWTHDITNVGGDEMVVMLWANEIFDRARPDTYACPV